MQFFYYPLINALVIIFIRFINLIFRLVCFSIFIISSFSNLIDVLMIISM